MLADAITHQNDGGLLDNLGGLGSLLGGGSQTIMAGNVLGMLLGGQQQNQVTQQISNNTGLGTGQVASLLMMLAPLYWIILVANKVNKILIKGGILDMLTGHQQQVQQAPQTRRTLSKVCLILTRWHAMDECFNGFEIYDQSLISSNCENKERVWLLAFFVIKICSNRF